MKKKVLLLASMGVLACTVGATILVVGGANQLDTFAVKADPVEYSVTFDESNTLVEVVDVYGYEYIAITTTTDNGNKVGVVGNHPEETSFTFNGASFGDFFLCDYDDVLVGRAYEFSTITGFAISFLEVDVSISFESMNERIHNLESGHEYKGLSITPYHGPMFRSMDSVTVISLTIWYTC